MNKDTLNKLHADLAQHKSRLPADDPQWETLRHALGEAMAETRVNMELLERREEPRVETLYLTRRINSFAKH